MKQSDIYTEALTCLRSILLADHPEFQNWIDWLERDIQDWNQRREVAHHLRAYGGMGSFNDLPSMRGNHVCAVRQSCSSSREALAFRRQKKSSPLGGAGTAQAVTERVWT